MRPEGTAQLTKKRSLKQYHAPVVNGLCSALIVPAYSAGARRQLSGTSRSAVHSLSILGNKGEDYRHARQIRCVRAQEGTNAEDNDSLPAHPPPMS
jgi:hypothetical protein